MSHSTPEEQTKTAREFWFFVVAPDARNAATTNDDRSFRWTKHGADFSWPSWYHKLVPHTTTTSPNYDAEGAAEGAAAAAARTAKFRCSNISICHGPDYGSRNRGEHGAERHGRWYPTSATSGTAATAADAQVAQHAAAAAAGGADTAQQSAADGRLHQTALATAESTAAAATATARSTDWQFAIARNNNQL